MTAALACMLAWSAGIVLAAVALPGAPSMGPVAVVGAVLAGCAGIVLRPSVVALAVAGLGVRRRRGSRGRGSGPT